MYTFKICLGLSPPIKDWDDWNEFFVPLDHEQQECSLSDVTHSHMNPWEPLLPNTEPIPAKPVHPKAIYLSLWRHQEYVHPPAYLPAPPFFIQRDTMKIPPLYTINNYRTKSETHPSHSLLLSYFFLSFLGVWYGPLKPLCVHLYIFIRRAEIYNW